MGLEKAIQHNKEKRKPYKKAKAVSKSCRNHGSCPWCKRNRLHKFIDKHPMDISEADDGRDHDAGENLKRKWEGITNDR